MKPTIYFVHGTGVRDVSGSVEQIRAGIKKVLGWEPDQVRAILWGTAIGPQDLDITPALPPRYRTRAAGGLAIETEKPAALWDVLLADPTAELRTVTLETPAEPGLGGGGIIDPSAPLGSQSLQDGLSTLTVGGDVLAAAGVTQAQLSAAATEIAGTGVVAEAAAHTSENLADEVSRAVVATVLRSAAASEPNTKALYDAAARDDLAEAVAKALAPNSRGLRESAKRFLSELGTRFAVQKRTDIMSPLSDFVRDVAFYLQHGAKMREYIEGELRKHDSDGPVVIFAHSLGGIACVDLLADAAVTGGANPLRVDLLVTIGSQAPWLYLLDALNSLSPKSPGAPAPFKPWLNIYNDEDLLSFCAKAVFAGFDDRIVDEPVDAGVPFPMSHSAYWEVDRVYELLRQHLPQ